MEWILPSLAIVIGGGIFVYLSVAKKRRTDKRAASKAPLCPGCTATCCVATGRNTGLNPVSDNTRNEKRFAKK